MADAVYLLTVFEISSKMSHFTILQISRENALVTQKLWFDGEKSNFSNLPIFLVKMRFLMIFNHCIKWLFYRILWYILSDLVICSKLDTMQWTGSRRLVILKLWNSVLLFSHLLWRKTFWWIIAGCQVQEHEGSLRVHTLQHTAAPLSDIAALYSLLLDAKPPGHSRKFPGHFWHHTK